MTNSLSKTTSLFSTKEEYLAFVRAWKTAARNKTLTKEDCLMRCLLLGQDINAVMPLTTSERRLANGARGCSGRQRAQDALCANPYRVGAAREAHVLERAAQGKRPLAYRMAPSWGEKWVNLADMASSANGLNASLLNKVLALSCQESVGWPVKAGA
jgi:hypothetical protein